MENTTDLLQLKIDKAKAILSKETREAIDAVNFKTVILGISGDYNSEQLENLQIETELLLCGLLNPEDYPKELETRMMISKTQAEKLVNEMDRLVFKKIQDELVKKIKSVEPIIFDSRFASLNQNIQEAIAKSNWQKKLYMLGIKNKLPVDKMALLEDITVKLILGKIPPDKYESGLASALQLDKDVLKETVSEVNERIMKVIRAFEQEQTKEEIEDEVPIPPYRKAPVENLSFKNESGIYANSGIQMVDEKQQGESLQKNEEEKITMREDKMLARQGIGMIEEKPEVENEHMLSNTETQKSVLEGVENPVKVATSIIGNKLNSPTVSMNKVSDYSLPKISKKDDEANKIPKPPEEGYTSKFHDPYHEEVI
jgi:hypothetical protein